MKKRRFEEVMCFVYIYGDEMVEVGVEYKLVGFGGFWDISRMFFGVFVFSIISYVLKEGSRS